MKKIPSDKINIFHGMETERAGMFAYDYLKKLQAVPTGIFAGEIRHVALRMDAPSGVSRIGDMCTICLGAGRNLCECGAPAFMPGCDFGNKFTQLEVGATKVCRLCVSPRTFMLHFELKHNISPPRRSQLYPKGLEIAVRPFAMQDADAITRADLSNLYERASTLDNGKSISLIGVGLQLKLLLGERSPEYFNLVQRYASPALKRKAV